MTRSSTLVLSCSLLLSAATAQPVLQSTDIGNATLQLGLVQGAANGLTSGANMTWNLTNASIAILGSAVFGPAAGTPSAAQFPTSTRSIFNVVPGFGSYYTYWKHSTTALEVTGDGIGTGQDEVYTDFRTILQFPFAFGNSFTDTYSIQGWGSGSETWTYSGYGTLITSLGTFTDVAQVRTEFDERVIFWNKTPLYPILEIDMDGDGTAMISSTVGVNDNDATPAVSLFPNPAHSVLNLTGINAGDRVTVLDALGRTVVAETAATFTGNHTMDVGHLTSGTYFVRVLQPTGMGMFPFVKE